MFVRWCLQCFVGILPTEGDLSLSQNFVIAQSDPSGILLVECTSHPVPSQCCTEDETLVSCTCLQNKSRVNHPLRMLSTTGYKTKFLMTYVPDYLK